MTMTITLIYTARQTNLTIDASGVTGRIELERMVLKGEPPDRKQLRSQEKNRIPVGPGVYKVSPGVTVTADIEDPQAFVAMEVETKDPPPTQPKFTVAMAKARLSKFSVDEEELHAFIADARGGINISLPGPSAR